jgi:carbamoyl-phosphate synthase large subunit
MEDARKAAAQIGSFPLVIRPAFTLGGMGGGIAYNREEFEEIVARRSGSFPSERGSDRGKFAWVEGIRNGGACATMQTTA